MAPDMSWNFPGPHFLPLRGLIQRLAGWGLAEAVDLADLVGLDQLDQSMDACHMVG